MKLKQNYILPSGLKFAYMYNFIFNSETLWLKNKMNRKKMFFGLKKWGGGKVNKTTKLIKKIQ